MYLAAFQLFELTQATQHKGWKTDWEGLKIASHPRQETSKITDRTAEAVPNSVLVAQSRPTLCNPVDCSPPSSSVHGILQARVLEWVAISFSRGSSRPRDRTQVSRIAGRCFNLWATREGCLIPVHAKTGNARFIHTFNKYPMRTYFVPGAVLSVSEYISEPNR